MAEQGGNHRGGKNGGSGLLRPLQGRCGAPAAARGSALLKARFLLCSWLRGAQSSFSKPHFLSPLTPMHSMSYSSTSFL